MAENQTTRCICREAGYVPCGLCTMTPEEREEYRRQMQAWLAEQEARNGK